MSQIYLAKQFCNSKHRLISTRMHNPCRFSLPSPRVNLENYSVHQLHKIQDFSANTLPNLEVSIKKIDPLITRLQHEEKCLRNVLHSFTPHELVQTIKEAAKVDAGIIEIIMSYARHNESHRRLSVSCLGPKTKSENLLHYFSRYGNVERAEAFFDKDTGKGSGSVTFETVEGFLLALEDPIKNIQGSIVFASVYGIKLSLLDEINRAERRIKVENVTPEMSSDSLISHFSRYGVIEQGPWGFDIETGNLWSCVCFLYKEEESAKTAVAKRVMLVDGFKVTCKMDMTDKKTLIRQWLAGYQSRCV